MCLRLISAYCVPGPGLDAKATKVNQAKPLDEPWASGERATRSTCDLGR